MTGFEALKKKQTLPVQLRHTVKRRDLPAGSTRDKQVAKKGQTQTQEAEAHASQTGNQCLH